MCGTQDSLLVDVDHAEGRGLVGRTLVLDSEDHDFVAGEAVALLFGHLEDQADQLLHVLLYKDTPRRLALVRRISNS